MENVLKLNGIVKKYKDFTLGGIDADIPKGFRERTYRFRLG